MQLHFAPFRLDLADERLWKGDVLVPLRPKAFAILRYLAERSGKLVTKDELLAAVWPGTSVIEAGLKVRVRELRAALGDDSLAPRFITTVARRGYRFIAPVVRTEAAGSSTTAGAPPAAPRFAPIVGRMREIGELEDALERARTGTRQVVYVTGEAGIGKTTLLNAFLASARLTSASDTWIGKGGCVEQYGAGEAYLPILEAVGGLCRGAGRETLPLLLRRYAPTWLVQLPWLLEPSEREALLREVQGVAQERMLREMADTLEAVAADRVLVLMLEDLHWSDYSTLDLLSLLTRRPGTARLLVIATYRPVDAILNAHPVKQLKQDLTLRGLSTEVALESFNADEAATYLAGRFPPALPPAAIAAAVYRRTDGNPLFLAAVADDLAAERVVTFVDGAWQWQAADDADIGVPTTIRQLVERQLERLSAEDRRLLEAASVAGVTFSSAAVGAALGEDAARCEEHCERLARHGHLLRAIGVGEWPDGSAIGLYAFTHALYRRVLHDGIAAGRRARLHARLAEETAAAYGDRAAEVAAELAAHFEEGRDYRRAIDHLQQAAANASRRAATREAVDHLTKAETLLAQLPDEAERLQRELGIQMALGPALMSIRGYATPEVERAFTRARALCHAMGDPAPLFPALWGIWGFHVVRGEMTPARALAEQCFAVAQQADDPDVLIEGHHALWVTLFFCGELTDALAHAEAGLALYRPEHRSHALVYGQDPGVVAHAYGGLASWYLGRPDAALRHVEDAVALGRAVGHPFSLGFALNFAAWVQYCRGDADATDEYAQALLALATEQGFPFWVAGAHHFASWVMVERGAIAAGLARMQDAVAAWRATGAGLGLPSHLGRLIEAHLKAGRVDDAAATLAEALAVIERSGQRYYEAELQRLGGEVLLAGAHAGKQRRAVRKAAEPFFTRARAIAARQQSRWLDVRAALSLGRLRQADGDVPAALRLVEEACRALTDDGASDAVAARELRRELRATSD